MPFAARPVELRSMQARTLRALGEPCGVIVFDPASREAAFRFRRDWDDFAREEAPTLAALAADLEDKFAELGPDVFFSWIDSSLSSSLSVDDMRPVAGRNAGTLAQALYRQAVRSEPKHYRTHLPLYSIRAAAGGFGPDSESEVEDWVEVHDSKTFNRDEFVLRIAGRSMEPDIPDGSLCLFRRYSGGSRGGQIVLVQRLTGSDTGGEVTIKRYSSDKQATGDSWEHSSIHMHPKNRSEFSDWDVQREENRYLTIAVFERVLEEPIQE